MADDFITVISYLSDQELQVVKKQLDQQRIIHVINQHGPHMGEYYNAYNEVKVSPRDFATAKRIISKFKASQFIEQQKCPKCGSLLHQARKLNLFQKIFYIGTKPVQCKKCKTKFLI